MRPTVLIATALAALTAAGCSSSSSGGATPLPTFPIRTSPGAYGPSGDITAPASNPPGVGVPGGTEIFPHVTAAQGKKLTRHLVGTSGVRTATYYPQFRQLQVYFTATATTADRDRVYHYVTAHDPATLGSASASASASPSSTS